MIEKEDRERGRTLVEEDNNETRESEGKDIIGSIITLYLAMPFLLWAFMICAGYVFKTINGSMTFEFSIYAFVYIHIATVSLPIGAILARLIKGKQAENDIDRKSISRKKIYIIYFFTIIYHVYIAKILIDNTFLISMIPIILYSSFLTRMLIINIKDEYKNRGLKAFIITHLLYVVCAGAGAVWLHL